MADPEICPDDFTKYFKWNAILIYLVKSSVPLHRRAKNSACFVGAMNTIAIMSQWQKETKDLMKSLFFHLSKVIKTSPFHKWKIYFDDKETLGGISV